MGVEDTAVAFFVEELTTPALLGDVCVLNCVVFLPDPCQDTTLVGLLWRDVDRSVTPPCVLPVDLELDSEVLSLVLGPVIVMILVVDIDTSDLLLGCVIGDLVLEICVVRSGDDTFGLDSDEGFRELGDVDAFSFLPVLDTVNGTTELDIMALDVSAAVLELDSVDKEMVFGTVDENLDVDCEDIVCPVADVLALDILEELLELDTTVGVLELACVGKVLVDIKMELEDFGNVGEIVITGDVLVITGTVEGLELDTVVGELVLDRLAEDMVPGVGLNEELDVTPCELGELLTELGNENVFVLG